MSQWTHVAGVIRFDCLTEELPTREALEAHLGVQAGYEELCRSIEPTIPSGSEGSIRYQILDVNPPTYEEFEGGSTVSSMSAARWVVVIWGDLRRFGKEDVPEIREWWTRITTETPTDTPEDFSRYISIRGGCLEIHVEGGPVEILHTQCARE